MRSTGIRKTAMEKDVGAIIDIFMHGASIDHNSNLFKGEIP